MINMNYIKKLMKINKESIKKINEKFKRKSLINIFMIKKLLNDTNKILLNLSEKTLQFYNIWLKSYIKYI